MSEPAVLFVKPGAVKPSDKAALRKAGIVVVEIEDPNDVKLVRAGMEVSHSDMLCAAMQAIVQGGSSNTKIAFAEALASVVLSTGPARS